MINSQGTVRFTLSELEGVPKDVLSGYKKIPASGDTPELYEITFKTPDIMPVVRRVPSSKHNCRLLDAAAAFFSASSNSRPTLPPGVAPPPLSRAASPSTCPCSRKHLHCVGVSLASLDTRRGQIL